MAFYKYKNSSPMSKVQAIKFLNVWQDWRLKNPELAKIVSSKINMHRSGSEYYIDLSGVVVTPKTQSQKMAAVRQSIEQHFSRSNMGFAALRRSEFSENLDAERVFEKFKDGDAWSHNAVRNRHMVRSNMIDGRVPTNALDALFSSMQSKTSVSFYATGGRSKEGIENTSLPPSDFVVEMEHQIKKANYQPSQFAELDRIHKSFVQSLGSNVAYPNYAGDAGQTHTPNQENLKQIRAVLDPQRLANNPLVDGHSKGYSQRLTCEKPSNSRGATSSANDGES